MTPYFATPDSISALQRVVGGWIGTPFHPNGMVKSVGASCQKLVGAILIECGHLDVEDVIPSGPMDWHQKESLIEQAMDRSFAGKFQTILGAPVGAGSSHLPHPPAGDPLTLLRPGDVLGFAIGDAVHHCGIMVSESEFLHTMRHSKATIATIWDATWCGRLRRIWRPVK